MEELALPPTTSSCLDLSISFPASPVPSPGGRRDMEEIRDLDINKIPDYYCAENEEELNSSTSSRMGKENHQDRGGSRKTLRLSKQQSKLLEECFRVNHSLDTKGKKALAVKLEVTPRQVEVWFQNRRARRKLKQREMECEYLRRWLSSLRDHNLSLQAEIYKLRSSICPCCHLINPIAAPSDTLLGTTGDL